MPDSDARVGQQLGHYRLVHRVGEGGFAEVYMGEHIHLDRQAAIKVLHTQLTQDDIEKFREEARTIARLEHPNIVPVLDFGVDNRTPYLVLSYAVNGSVRQRFPKGSRVPLATIVSYVKQVAAALQYAHDAKLIHRDVKPENMLLGKQQEILLSDFGIAVMAQSSRYQNPQDMAGTMTYMAPEQIQGKARPASDQYSLGIVVYEWLTGQRPFHGSLTELIGQHISTPPPSILKIVPTLHSTVETVVMKALAKDPKDRYARIVDFTLAFEQACKNAPPQTPAATPFKAPIEKSPETRVVAPSEVYQALPASERVIAPPIQLPVPDRAVSSQKTIKQWFYEAITSLEHAEYIEALAAINHVLVLDANLGYAYNAQGLALYYLKLYAEALTALDRAIQLNPRDATAHFGKGLALEQLQRYAEALNSYEQVTRLEAAYAAGWRKKGDMLSHLKRYEESLAAYEQALKLDPNDAETYIGKGTVLKLLGRKI